MECAPRDFIHNTSSFQRACRTGSRPTLTSPAPAAVDTTTNTTTIPPIEPFTYAAHVVPHKVVHLIRSPFDNIIGRMHLAVKRRQKQQQQQQQQGLRRADRAQEAATQFVDSSEGLAAWCRHLDEKYQQYYSLLMLDDDDTNASLSSSSSSLSRLDKKYSMTVPCHMEWFRYIQWHNRAVEVTSNMQQQQQEQRAAAADSNHHHQLLPVYYLYYENYTLHYNETVHELLTFLQLDAVGAPKPFKAGKSYLNFFHATHVQAATRMVQDLSLPATWNLIRHYFNDTTTRQQPPLEKDNYTSANEKTVVAAPTGKPDVVWLMSFPNSGTSYTISNTEQVTNFSTASNYAGDWKDYVPPSSTSGHNYAHLGYNGPFVHKPALGLAPTSLLTKTQ